MKYILEPDNRNCPDDMLCDDIRQIAAKLEKITVTKDEYNALGRFSTATMQNRFGTWNNALKMCRLVVGKRTYIPAEEILDDIKRVAAELQLKSLSTTDYTRVGAFSVETIRRNFGVWHKALLAAGLEIPENWRPKATDDELLSNLALVWEMMGRQPKASDLPISTSRISSDIYVRRFGSWRKALECFVEFADQLDADEFQPKQVQTSISVAPIPKKRTQREPSWRLRFLINRRDRFACCACGRSPATHLGVVLHVDHIVPWSQGGETVFENLQTLCEVCNLGKSDLAMNAPNA